jgi:glycosyltransferase involved in cell wall biosynthesis
LKRIADSNHDQQFFYCGTVESPREFFKLCDFLVLPSFAEGVPNVVLEAASVGTLSLLSKIGIHRDLESQGLAVTFNHLDFSDFIAKVRKASEYTSESSKGRIVSTWRTHFSGDKTLEVYKAAIQRAIG